MGNFAAVAGIAGPVVLELLRFARSMRALYGDDLTDEQIAEMWEQSRNSFKAAAEAWRNS